LTREAVRRPAEGGVFRAGANAVRGRNVRYGAAERPLAGTAAPRRPAEVREATVLPSVAASVESLDGHGEALDAPTRVRFEAQLGHDFSRVRVHRDEEAARTAAALGASAFAYGPHVVFGAGTWSPDSGPGQALLEHELAHVAAQADAGQALVEMARLRDFVDVDPLHDPSRLTDAQIEATSEYRTFTDTALVWQTRDKVTPDEARLTCRLMLRALRDGQAVAWGDAATFLSAARAQLGTLTAATALAGSLNWVAFNSPMAASAPAGLASDFGRWLLAAGSAPDPATGKMNCWELLMFSAFRAGVVTFARLQAMYSDAAAKVTAGTVTSFGDVFETTFRRGGEHGFSAADPNTPRPLPGDVVIFTRAANHAAMATGTRDGAGRHEIISHWPPPDGSFQVKRTTIEQLLADPAMAPGTTVKFWSVRW
jgi:hypothetical protein